MNNSIPQTAMYHAVEVSTASVNQDINQSMFAG